MASHQHDALWVKLRELELQLAAYKLLRATRGEDVGADGRAVWATEATCRGRQYEAYMRRRDARREAAMMAMDQRQAMAQQLQTRGTRTEGGGSKPMGPRGARSIAWDAQEVKKTPTVPNPTTPRRDRDTGVLPRSRTVSGGAAGVTSSPARSHHERRSSLGAPADYSDSPITPRPFLKRGTGTGGAAAPARLRTPRVHDLPSIDALVTPRQPLLERGRAHVPRHVRSVSELPFDAAALASPQRARKRWGSPERQLPAATHPAPADSHRDFSKGLKKLLSFVRKGSGKGDADPAVPGIGGSGKPVSNKGWSGGMAACSVLDVPFDRASLQDGHRFPMTRTVGISG